MTSRTRSLGVALISPFTTRIPVALVILAMVTGAPLGIALGKAYVEHAAPAPPAAESDAPTTPRPLTPEANAVGVSRTPTFRWSQSYDASPVSYALAYSVDPTFRTNVHEVVVFGMTNTEYAVPPEDAFPAGATVWWMVQAVDAHNNFSPWSGLSSFTVGAE